MVAISLSGSGEGLGRAIARGYSTAFTKPPTVKTRIFLESRFVTCRWLSVAGPSCDQCCERRRKRSFLSGTARSLRLYKRLGSQGSPERRRDNFPRWTCCRWTGEFAVQNVATCAQPAL